MQIDCRNCGSVNQKKKYEGYKFVCVCVCVCSRVYVIKIEINMISSQSQRQAKLEGELRKYIDFDNWTDGEKEKSKEGSTLNGI